ncbi:MAG: DnaJ domain-containing protein [Clostridia bacterium]|nr:DnaJ domain-containing protein [Clostridia bacterium]
MKYKNYYAILEVNRKSSDQDIKLNFRRLAKEYHPDKNRQPGAEEKFKDINEAYAVLMDAEKRRKYDRQVAKYGYGFANIEEGLRDVKIKPGTNVFNDLLNQILGFKREGTSQSENEDIDSIERKQKPIKGTDIITHLDVTLEEGFFGAEKKIAIKAYKTGMKTFSVKVPVGIKNGDKIRLAALGNPGKNGGKNGDLIIHVKLLENEEFKLSGADFIKEIDITPAVAALGGKYKLQVMDEKLFVSLPKHLRDGEIVTVPNKGYVKEDGQRGDLNLKVHIDLPEDISEREEKLYEQLLKIERKREEFNY